MVHEDVLWGGGSDFEFGSLELVYLLFARAFGKASMNSKNMSFEMGKEEESLEDREFMW